MSAKGLTLEPRFVRSGEFREEVAYSARARSLRAARPPDRALCRQRPHGARRDARDRRLGLRCPEDISIASTDNIPGISGLRPNLTRTEHPIVDMVNEAVRLLVDRIEARRTREARHVVFPSALVVGDSCAPLRG